MDIKLSPVGVSGRCIRQPGNISKTTQSKPLTSCHSCSDDQHSFTSEDREKSLNSCFTDHDSSNNPFPSSHPLQHPQQSISSHHHQYHNNNSHNHHHLDGDYVGNHADRDLDSPDQDYDFNSRFSPPPTDNSYHSENHCQCYEDDDDNDTDSEADFIGSGLESSGRTATTTTTTGARRSANQYRANHNRRSRGGQHRRHCSMDQEEEADDEELVTKDTVCIIESEGDMPNSARELKAKTLAAKGRKGTMATGVTMAGLSSPSSKSYHNICSEMMMGMGGGGGGRSYELAKSGQSGNFGAVSGSSHTATTAAACGKLFDKVCINNSCSGCTGGPVGGGGGGVNGASGVGHHKRSPVGAVAGMSAEGVGVGGNGHNRNNRKSNGTSSSSAGGCDGINEFMHGFAGTATPNSVGGGVSSKAAAVAAAMELAASYGPQIKWTRNNIAATMERYEPSTSSSSAAASPCHSPNRSHAAITMQQQQQQMPRHHYHCQQGGGQPGAMHNGNFHHDYSYAYYEPGAAMRHANIPGSPAIAGPSHPLPPNSIQALLLKSHGYQAKLQRQATAIHAAQAAAAAGQAVGGPSNSSRHAYTTRYGTQENIYEEIGNEDRIRMMMAANGNNQSMVSLNQSLVEEEFRQVHNRHRRVLGELNLSVEAMIMPVNPPNETSASTGREGGVADGATEDGVINGSPSHRGSSGGEKNKHRNKVNEFMMKPIRNPHLNHQVSRNVVVGGCSNDALAVGVTDCGQINADMDSGFSGSSSGASYVGSLRYQKSCCAGGGANVGPSLMGRGQRAYEEPAMSSFSTRSSSSYGSCKSSNNLQRMLRSAEDPGPSSSSGMRMPHNHHHAINMNGLPSTSATLKPMSKNASFWSKKGWKIIPGFSSSSAGGANKASSPSTANILSG